MLRASSAAAIATAFLMLVPASPGHALTGSDLECQTTIGTAARTFAAAKHKAIVECNNALVGGQRCNAARRDKRILKALDKMVRSVVSACRRTALGDLGFPGQCFDPTFGDFSVGDLTDCLDQSHSSSVDFVFVPVEYPHPLGLFGDERRCQRVIGSASQVFVAHELRARAQCLNDQLRQKLPATVDCRADAPGTGDDDTDKRLIAAGNDLFARLLDACAGVALDHLGFPGFCFDATGGAFDVTDLRRCIRETHASVADQLTAIEYPAGTSNHSPTPTPVGPTPIPTPGGPCDFTAARLIPDGFGSDLDLGWTGLLHNQRLVTDAALSFTVTGCDSPVQPCVCRFEGPVANRDAENGVIDNHRCVGDTAIHCSSDDECGSDGPCAYFFGSTLPLSGGGVGTCITNQIDGAVSGSVDTGSGAADVALALVARVSSGLDFAAPCPVCAGDPLPNDGIREGVCGGGLHEGDQCDANGLSPVPSFGITSLDCPPNPGAEIAALDLQWDLTTGTTVRTLTASSPACTDFGVADRKCFCAGAGAPTRPNACIDDTVTPEDESLCSGFFEQGFCAGGPFDQACAIESFRGCLSDQDCPAPFDFCVTRARECFADNGFVGGSVSASGTTDPFFGGSAFPTFAALFCTGPTSSAAVNYATGLPGLGRLRLPGELSLSTEQPPFCGDGVVDAGEACDPPGSDACGPAASCQTDCTCALPSCSGDERSLNLRADAGGDLDYGWTGIAHDQTLMSDARLPATLLCTGDACTITDGTPVGAALLSPLPLSAGGVSSCVVTTVREPVSGDYDCGTGCGSRDVKVRADVYLVQEAAEPCPVCVGDGAANDGVKGGFCDSGATPGRACDVGGINPIFGATSRDCLPSGSSVGELDLELALTTGPVSASASVDCLSGAFPAGSCQCPNQVQPNSCLPDGICPASGVCEQGPIDGVCSGQRYRQCRSGMGTEDCEDVFPGAGTCQDQPRPCFGDTIARSGQCGVSDAVLAAIFCVPATRAAAINTTAGLPGPAALLMPVQTDGCRCDGP